MSLPDCLTRSIEPRWSSVIPTRSILVIERDDGSIEFHAKGKGYPWKGGAGMTPTIESNSDANKIRRLKAAIRLIEGA